MSSQYTSNLKLYLDEKDYIIPMDKENLFNLKNGMFGLGIVERKSDVELYAVGGAYKEYNKVTPEMHMSNYSITIQRNCLELLRPFYVWE